MLYKTVLHGPFERSELTIDGLHDRALIYVDGKLAGIQERTGRRNDAIYLELEAGQTAVLRILVENMGRINYGPKLLDCKGILRGVKLGCQYQFGWKHYSLPCDCPPQQGYEPVGAGADAPLFFKGQVSVQQRRHLWAGRLYQGQRLHQRLSPGQILESGRPAEDPLSAGSAVALREKTSWQCWSWRESTVRRRYI